MNQPVQWSPGVTLEAVEKQVILNAFRFYRGNKTQCAISLGINVRTLERKLEDYAAETKKQEEFDELDRVERERILRHQRGIVGEGNGSRVLGSASGVHVEPTFEAPEKHAVPVPERQEIQSVLPKHVAASGKSGRR